MNYYFLISPEVFKCRFSAGAGHFEAYKEVICHSKGRLIKGISRAACVLTRLEVLGNGIKHHLLSQVKNKIRLSYINHPGLAEMPAPVGFLRKWCQTLRIPWVFHTLKIAECKTGPLRTQVKTQRETGALIVGSNLTFTHFLPQLEN